jgi:hypothetical protein
VDEENITYHLVLNYADGGEYHIDDGYLGLKGKDVMSALKAFQGRMSLGGSSRLIGDIIPVLDKETETREKMEDLTKA